MDGPLDGVRVVEVTMFQQGPVAGMRLGDLGAEVSTLRFPIQKAYGLKAR